MKIIVCNKLPRKHVKKGSIKFRMNAIEIELMEGNSFFFNLGEISGCVMNEGTNLFALCLNDYEDKYHDDLLIMFVKTTTLSRITAHLTGHLLTTRDDKLEDITSPTDARNNLPNINKKWRQKIKELKPNTNWFVGQLADCPDQFCRMPDKIKKYCIMAFDDTTVDARQGLIWIL